jgi:hypothetical protein
MAIGLTFAMGADDKGDAAQIAKEWIYPMAKTGSSAKSGSVALVIQRSPDDVPTIFKHYGKILGLDLENHVKQGIAAVGAPNGAFVLSSPADGNQEGDSAHVLTATTKNACVTVVLERRKDAKLTTITVSLFPLDKNK